MKKLLLITWILTLAFVANGYFEISNDIPTVFKADGTQEWRMWSGNDSAEDLFIDSSGILFDDVFSTIIIGKFTPGDAPATSVDIGYFAGQGSPIPAAASHTGIGFRAGGFNTGSNQSALGFFAGFHNTGVFHTAIGAQAGRDNDGANNTALGYTSFNVFNLDTGNAQVITSVDFANNQVTISGGHGFGANDSYINLAITTTGSTPAGLDGFDVWLIVSSTVLEVFSNTMTDAGTGTHTLTPQFVYTNSTAVGFNAQPDASNQVVLGDTNVTSIKTTGAFESPLKVTNSTGTDAVITMDGTSNNPADFTYQSDNALLNWNKVMQITGIADGGRTNYDLKVGDTDGTPTYGMIQFGNAVIGRTSYKAGNIDLDGAVIVQNLTGPITSEIEFVWTESAGDTCRFALPQSAVGNATYNSRSMLLAGPAPADTDFVKVSYWQGQGIFDNLVCDTSGTGADLGVQNDLEVEGDIFVDSIKESTSGADITLSNDTNIDGDLNVDTDVLVVDAVGDTVNGAVFSADTDENILFGDSLTGSSITTGARNVYIGFAAGRKGTEGDDNIFCGSKSGAGASSTPTGDDNVALGTQTCGWNSLTSGDGNFCLGTLSGSSLTSGRLNVLIGARSGTGLTTQTSNVFIGSGAGKLGQLNVCIGTDAGMTSTNDRNVLIGYKTAELLSTGTQNTIIGWESMQLATTADHNTSIGYLAGHNTTTGDDNVFIGYNAGHNTTTESDLLVIDNQDRGSAANEAIQSLIFGTFNATVASQILAINAGTFTLNAGVDTDMVINFTGTTNSGVVTWMEDEDYFKFSDDVLLDTGVMYIKETTSPTPIADHGVVFTTSDDELFFQDGAGNDHLVHGDAFSSIWFHGVADTVTIAAEDAFAKITSFENVGVEDDLANMVGNTTTNDITVGSVAGGNATLEFHAYLTSTGASKEMMVAIGIELATPLTITNATNATPIVITSVAHGLCNGDMVTIADVVTNTAANGDWMVSAKTDDTFAILVPGGANTTGNGAYGGGGTVDIEYSGSLIMHRELSQTDLGGGGNSGIHELAAGDKVALYIMNLDDANDADFFQATLEVTREGD